VASRLGVGVILTGVVEYGIEGEPYAVSSWSDRRRKVEDGRSEEGRREDE
jgi:hypothetical protein